MLKQKITWKQAGNILGVDDSQISRNRHLRQSIEKDGMLTWGAVLGELNRKLAIVSAEHTKIMDMLDCFYEQLAVSKEN